MTTTQLTRGSKITPGFLAWLAFLGLCLIVGLVAAIQVFSKGLGITNLSNTVPWGLWITVDLSAIALGAGAFTLSAVVYLFRVEQLRPIVRLAVFVGFLGYSSALMTLIMDIGRPDRFWHPWVYWNVHSVLWEITWCITIYTAILVVEFAPVIAELPMFSRWAWMKKVSHWIHKATPALALVGLLISLLHQSSLGATYGVIKSRPIWFKPSMPIMFILSAIAIGPALTMASAYLIEWVTGKRVVSHSILHTIARFSGFGILIYTYIKFWDYLAVTYYGQTPAVNQALYLLNQDTPYGFGFWFVEVILGLAIPAFLFLWPKTNRKPGYLILGTILAVIGLVFNRWNVTVSGLFVPVDFSPGTIFQLNPGVYFPNLYEWGVVLGIVGYALLVFTLGVRYLPLFTADSGTHG